MQDALAAAVEEITCELAPGRVELRLRGRDPEFVVTPPADDLPPEQHQGEPSRVAPAATGVATPTSVESSAATDGGLSRINLRMPDQLKARIEQAASDEELSVNSWLVRAASAALERTDPGRRRPPGRGELAQRYTGWAR
jgi:predicted HicB family RNase H-like nuclease